jgi:hypothetical protein
MKTLTERAFKANLRRRLTRLPIGCDPPSTRSRRVAPEQARKVVLSGNIRRFSMGLRSLVNVSPCKRGACRTIILLPNLRPTEDGEVSSTGRKYVVTIYSGTDC